MVTNHIPTEQARQQGLPGSDVFRFSHLLYHDPLNRDAGVVYLNVEAHKAFSDTVLISHRHALAAEQKAVKEWLAAGGSASRTPLPWGAMTFRYMDYVNYENLKIAAGFELHLKARLLSKDFVVHEIDGRSLDYKTLAKEQETRPISKSELFIIRSYYFDGQQNYLPGLKDTSLKYSKLTDEPEYRKMLDLSDDHLDMIKDYRDLRNQIHLPGDIVESPKIQGYRGSIVDFIVGFVNAEIVEYTNGLIGKYQLNRRPLVPFL
jgi:hypothetical protein